MPEDLNISKHITGLPKVPKAGRHQRFPRDLCKSTFVVDVSVFKSSSVGERYLF